MPLQCPCGHFYAGKQNEKWYAIGTGNEDHELELVLLYMFATISFF